MSESKICPSEPTREMIDAGAQSLWQGVTAIYRAMIALCPAADSERADAARLDFVLERQAFIVTVPPHEELGTLYQLWTQNEGERYHILSGDGHFFASARRAIDVAIAKEAK